MKHKIGLAADSFFILEKDCPVRKGLLETATGGVL